MATWSCPTHGPRPESDRGWCRVPFGMGTSSCGARLMAVLGELQPLKIEGAENATVDDFRAAVDELDRLNADLDHEAREHVVTHERWMEAKAEVERLKRLLDQRGKDAADAEDEVERLRVKLRAMEVAAKGYHDLDEASRAEVERLRDRMQRLETHYEQHGCDDYGAWLREENAR